jgi:hypothetical protein
MSLAEVAAIPWPGGDRYSGAWHYFNHLLINPSGTRFTVLHRYRPFFIQTRGVSRALKRMGLSHA